MRAGREASRALPVLGLNLKGVHAADSQVHVIFTRLRIPLRLVWYLSLWGSDSQTLWSVSVPPGSLYLSFRGSLCICLQSGPWVCFSGGECVSREAGTSGPDLPPEGGPGPQTGQWIGQGCPGCLPGAHLWRQRCRAPAAGSGRAPQSRPGQLSRCCEAGDREGWEGKQ